MQHNIFSCNSAKYWVDHEKRPLFSALEKTHVHGEAYHYTVYLHEHFRHYSQGNADSEQI